jgi:hypothetical protein
VKAIEVMFDRSFVLGAKAGVPERLRVSLTYSIEGDETPESVEEFIMEKLYGFAERERKRRWAKLRQWAEEAEAKQEQQTNTQKTLKEAAMEARSRGKQGA